jgi:hypothetical protein
MTEPRAADGPVALYVDYAGFYIAYHAWRTICATKDRAAAERCLAYHLKSRPGCKVVGSWE